jgi:AbrB family looped-hinge helix DNA binding protein
MSRLWRPALPRYFENHLKPCLCLTLTEAGEALPKEMRELLIVRHFYLTRDVKIGGHAMSTLTITAKGQITLRKDLLKHLGVHPGEKIIVDKLPDGRIEVKAAPPTGKISDVFNLLKKEDSPSLSIEEINEIAARGWTGK